MLVSWYPGHGLEFGIGVTHIDAIYCFLCTTYRAYITHRDGQRYKL